MIYGRMLTSFIVQAIEQSARGPPTTEVEEEKNEV